jgi:hypothetical protein
VRLLAAIALVACGPPPVNDLDVQGERKELNCGHPADARHQEACRILDEFQAAQPFECVDQATFVGREVCVGRDAPPQLPVWKVRRGVALDRTVQERSQLPVKALLGCAQDFSRLPATDTSDAAVAALEAGRPAILDASAVHSVPDRWSPLARSTGVSAAAYVDGARAYIRRAGAKLLLVWPSKYGGCYRELWALP